MDEIEVSESGASEFEVSLTSEGRRSLHRVSVSEAERSRYGGGTPAARLVEESFRFLLEREPARSILARFELGVIERYFPEYPEEIRRRLGKDAD